MMAPVVSINIGDTVLVNWTVTDISYSKCQRYIYLHTVYQRTKRTNPVTMVDKYLPFDRIEWSSRYGGSE